MGVNDGTPVDAATTNPAFIDANQDDTGYGKITLANADALVSGGTINNLQQEHNSIANFTGKATNNGINALPTYTEDQGFTPNNNLQARASELSAKFNKTTGHSHRQGQDGDGAPIDASDIIGSPNRGFAQAGVNLTGVSGGSTDVSTELSAQAPSNGPTIAGVVVNAPYNKVILRQAGGAEDGDKFVDDEGNEVYGRVTEAATVWTLTYYVNDAGVETPYSFASPVDVAWYYQLLSPILNPGTPVYSELFFVPSENATADVVDATELQRGLVNTVAQNFGGAKTFKGSLILEEQLVGDIATDAATTGADAALPAPTKVILKVTNATLASIATITGAANNRFFVLVNKTGNTVEIKDNVGADGIITGLGDDLDFENESTLWLFRDNPESRWRIIGGTGAGGGGGLEPANIVEIDDTDSPYAVQPTDKVIVVDASAGEVIVTMRDASTFADVKELRVRRKDTNEDNLLRVQTFSGTQFINGVIEQEVLPGQSFHYIQEAVNNYGRY